MKKLWNKIRNRNKGENLLNGIIDASYACPNDMEFGRCIRNFMFECTAKDTVDDSIMYKIMQKCIKDQSAKQNKV
tara:strand:- start:65 stop:289 length:225 start_codon:yes stop_codon:yes gene_type:complete